MMVSRHAHAIRHIPRCPLAQTLLLLALASLVPADGDDIIGYYVDGSTTITARCRDATKGVLYETDCVEVEYESLSTQRIGLSCEDDTWLWGTVLRSTSGRMGDDSGEGHSCRGGNGDCITETVYGKSPDPGYLQTTVTCAGEVGLPAEARTLYHTLPDHTADSEPSSSDSPSQSIDGDRKDMGSGSDGNQEGSEVTDNSEEDVTDDGGNNAGMITGAVVGSIAVVALVIAAFLLGRHRARRSYAANEQSEVRDGITGPAELANGEPRATRWEKIQIAFGLPRHDGPRPVSELDGRQHVPELDGIEGARLQELPGQQPPISELDASPRGQKEADTSGENTSKEDILGADTQGDDASKVGTSIANTPRLTQITETPRRTSE